MVRMLRNGSQNAAPAKSGNANCFDSLPWESEDANYDLNNDTRHAAINLSIEPGRKSEQINSKNHVKNNTGVQWAANFRSKSLGCELDKEGRILFAKNTEDHTSQVFFCDGSHDCNVAELSAPIVYTNSSGTTPPDQDQDVFLPKSPQICSDHMIHELDFSLGDPHFPEKSGHENSDASLYFESAGDSGSLAPPTPPTIGKSSSMPKFGFVLPASCPPCTFLASCTRSFEHLSVADVKRKGILAYDANSQEMPEQEGDANLYMFEKYEGENSVNDGYGCYSLAGSSEDWIITISDDVHMGQNLLGESSFCQWDQFPGKGFKLNCIEEWVIDLQHCSPVEEKNEMPDSLNQVKRGSVLLDGLKAARVEAKINPGMEAAKRYVSSLNPTTASAQLANHGLAVIPFLGAFVSLKVLILSGNSIVRITGGALPRGLHLLNLSKNKISTLEGLRELTRLRILDLSYNKIVRIGHGLASCSSLKELYLAGNRISEVEGLHRLLKLTVLDLCLNKISTSKCLGQLAANYNSLKAISLEGNPAQKNVGDEQLKKYLLSLLPQLSYYNWKPIKSSKDSADRSFRLGTSFYQLDCGIVSDHESSRRGGHSVAALKQSFVATTKQKGRAADLPKRSRGKHGTKTIHRPHHHLDFGSKRLGSGPDFSIHRSQSGGSLSAM